MKYIDFYSALKHKKIFSIDDFHVFKEKITSLQLHRWIEKGYIKRICRRYYLFSEYVDISPLIIANTIYQPSYITQEYALNHYNIIPDIPFFITSVSTNKTTTFSTDFGKFIYKSIKRDYFWGYKVIDINQYPVKIADLEKCLVDYFYFHPEIKDVIDFNELRWNKEELEKKLNINKIEKYIESFKKEYLKRIYAIFLSFLHT